MNIDAVASRIKDATGFSTQVLRNINTIIISGTDGADQNQLLEKIREIDGVKIAHEDVRVELID